ncbi:MAG TPA: hypothetical protein VGR96_11895 [Acidobacteriaceae bacterium]|nr:hypothetical protein [Acidobacteriaceae bacterium]
MITIVKDILKQGHKNGYLPEESCVFIPDSATARAQSSSRFHCSKEGESLILDFLSGIEDIQNPMRRHEALAAE